MSGQPPLYDVILGVAHTQADPGCSAGSIVEHAWSESATQACAWALAAGFWKVNILREEDPSSNEALRRKVKQANRLGSVIAVEIHLNAAVYRDDDNREQTNPHPRGPLVLAWGTSELGMSAARAVLRSLTTRPGGDGFNQGVARLPDPKYGRKGWVEDTACPAIIVEAGFVTNADDLAWLESQGSAEWVGAAVARALCLWLGETDRARFADGKPSAL